MEFSRSDVIEQLKNLGYDEVPDDVVEEFIAELKQDRLLSNQNFEGNEKFEEVSDDENVIYEDENISSPQNKRKIQNQRYGIPRKNFHVDQETKEDPTNSVNIDISSEEPQKTKMNESIYDEDSYISDEEGLVKYEKPLLMLDESYRAPRVSISKRAKKVNNFVETKGKTKRKKKVMFSPPKVRYQSYIDGNEYEEYNKGLKRPKSSVSLYKRSTGTKKKSGRKKKITYRKYKKRTDPVSLYHQMKNNWDNDKFLSKSTRRRKHLRYQVRREMLEISRNVNVL